MEFSCGGFLLSGTGAAMKKTGEADRISGAVRKCSRLCKRFISRGEVI